MNAATLAITRDPLLEDSPNVLIGSGSLAPTADRGLAIAPTTRSDTTRAARTGLWILPEP